MDKRILLAHWLFSSWLVYAIVIYFLWDATWTPQHILLYILSALVFSTIVMYTTVFPVWKNRVLEEKSWVRQSSLFVLWTACIESSIVYILVCSLLLITWWWTELPTLYPVLFCCTIWMYWKSVQFAKILQESTQEEIFPTQQNQIPNVTSVKTLIFKMIPYEILSIWGCIGTIILLYS